LFLAVGKAKAKFVCIRISEAERKLAKLLGAQCGTNNISIAKE
jgi:hypothetical protein